MVVLDLVWTTHEAPTIREGASEMGENMVAQSNIS